MEAIRIKGVAHKGVLSVSVPEEFDEKELEITLLPIENRAIETEVAQNHEEKVKRLMSIAGAAKFPDTPITKYDVYEQ